MDPEIQKIRDRLRKEYKRLWGTGPVTLTPVSQTDLQAEVEMMSRGYRDLIPEHPTLERIDTTDAMVFNNLLCHMTPMHAQITIHRSKYLRVESTSRSLSVVDRYQTEYIDISDIISACQDIDTIKQGLTNKPRNILEDLQVFLDQQLEQKGE